MKFYNNTLDFLKLFFPNRYVKDKYDLSYAYKADNHALNTQSIKEIEWVGNKVNPQNIILDIGCNTGRPLALLAKLWNSEHGFGVDINHDAIDIAVSNFESLKFQIFDGLKLPFDDCNFDHVMIHHVIGHVQDPVKILEEVYRVLKPNGTLSIITPNYWYKFYQYPINIIKNFNPDLTILRYYSKRSLIKLVTNCGLKLNSIEISGPYPSFFKFNYAKLRILTIAKKL